VVDPDRTARDWAGRDFASREEAARDAAMARAPVAELEPWPASSTWLASAAGCWPETELWVGGGVPEGLGRDCAAQWLAGGATARAGATGRDPPASAAGAEAQPTAMDGGRARADCAGQLGGRSAAGSGGRCTPAGRGAAARGRRARATGDGFGPEERGSTGPRAGATARHAEGAPHGKAVISGRESETTPARGPASGPSGVPQTSGRPVDRSRRCSGPVRGPDVAVLRPDVAAAVAAVGRPRTAASLAR
jgi:hypothetical protein